jgi:hypothetical protein
MIRSETAYAMAEQAAPVRKEPRSMGAIIGLIATPASLQPCKVSN